jgi:predicted DsbA family dithiol-disulfide isomerase
MNKRIRIDVVSDVVCPWCYIGKRRLEKAVNRLADSYGVEIEYHPFELNPEMPLSGVDHKAYLIKKFGSRERYNQLTGNVTAVAETEGLEFNYERQNVAPNTRKSHALIQFAKSQGRQLELVEIFFKAYFTAGTDLSKDENLIELASEAGLSASDVKALFANDSAILQTALQEQEMYALGITGVPFFIINNKYAISGAQSADTFEAALREIGEKVEFQGESCDTQEKNC